MARRHEDDDGRTIADMNIPGLPGHRRPKPRHAPQSARETWRLMRSALLAGLLVGTLLLAALALFVLFCTHIWLR